MAKSSPDSNKTRNLPQRQDGWSENVLPPVQSRTHVYSSPPVEAAATESRRRRGDLHTRTTSVKRRRAGLNETVGHFHRLLFPKFLLPAKKVNLKYKVLKTVSKMLKENKVLRSQLKSNCQTKGDAVNVCNRNTSSLDSSNVSLEHTFCRNKEMTQTVMKEEPTFK